MTDETSPPPATGSVEPTRAPASVPRVVDLASLLQGANELRIAHGDALYVLRLTRQNKLILTK